jgi:hypothetical protein
VQAERDRRLVARRQFILAIDNRNRRVVFANGPELTGVAYHLFVRLAEQYRRDEESRMSKSKYAFVSSKELCNTFRVDGERLRKRVLAARASLTSQFSDAIDYLIDEQDIIQSRRWSGYRLNPYLILVDVAELPGPAGPGAATERNDNSEKRHDKPRGH